MIKYNNLIALLISLGLFLMSNYFLKMNEKDTFISELFAWLGYIFFFFGFFLLRDKHRREVLLLNQEKLKGNLITERCQSCAIKFRGFTNEHGTESDGITKNNLFCSDCYDKGEYTNPNLTKNEVITNFKKSIKNEIWKYQTIFIPVKSIVDSLERWINRYS